jgi:hypothetical protein
MQILFIEPTTILEKILRVAREYTQRASDSPVEGPIELIIRIVTRLKGRV